MLNRLILVFTLCLSFNFIQANVDQTINDKIETLYYTLSNFLDTTINTLDYKKNTLTYKHILKVISADGSSISFTDGMTFKIDWWYQSIAKNWKENDQVYISYDFHYQQYKIEHAYLSNIVWAKIKTFLFPLQTIKAISSKTNDPDAYSKITLDNGYVFKSIENKAFGTHGWQVNNQIIIFANSDEFYQILNIEKNQIILSNLVANMNDPIEIKDILRLEDRLNAKVLQQTEATAALFTSLLNYTAGLNNKRQPVGVFLFLGPTGVGKTELAKVLTNEIYKDSSNMIRFDMSHFTEPHSISRLIGSPPGYVNQADGGQLTNPLQENSQTVVLLDEIEKAHPKVIKTFLPVFDEGFISDAKNNLIACSETIFIMTSNLCGKEISQFFNLGYSTEEILQAIEPTLMESLSPEFYNRVEPVLFKPLAKETMGALVEVMIDKLKKRLLIEKNILILMDDSLKDFLVENGYNPLLGARPLKRLIEKRVLTALSYSIIKNVIESGSELLLFYDKETNSVIVQNNK